MRSWEIGTFDCKSTLNGIKVIFTDSLSGLKIIYISSNLTFTFDTVTISNK